MVVLTLVSMAIPYGNTWAAIIATPRKTLAFHVHGKGIAEVRVHEGGVRKDARR